MNRFVWLVRREVWEHKAIWMAPAIVIGCLFLLMLTSQVHLGFNVGTSMVNLPAKSQIVLHQLAYTIVAMIIFFVMGVIAFFYSIDSLYADRSDRSVLFWKSLPLSDSETVLSKFATGAVLIPVVAMLGALVAQLLSGGAIMARLAMEGHAAGYWLHPQALAGGATAALIVCVTVALWYAPLIAYLMLASAWAPRAPFLWAVLPPVAATIVEAMVLETSTLRDFILRRLLGVADLISSHGPKSDPQSLPELIERLQRFDVAGRLRDFYASPELWLGLVAAALLLTAAMWVRRYRDENS
jgi:ABC-2 type transport system permease protein